MEILAVRSALGRPSAPHSNWDGTALGKTMNKSPPGSPHPGGAYGAGLSYIHRHCSQINQLPPQ
jgi:hypothetical protein